MGITESPLAEVARTVRERFRAPEARSAACLNCGEALTGPFCAQCGQRDIPPYPSVRELVVDAFWELSGWDGRFAATVRTLFRHPGRLTREFLEGRRARYISPLRLYLMASLAYFLVAATVPASRSKSTVSVGGVNISTLGDSTAASRGSTGGSRSGASQPLALGKRDSSLRDMAKVPPMFRPMITRSRVDPVGFRRGLIDAMPRALFALVPVFAGIVALFYHRRKYPEHLYFAIHLHAFVFLALAMAELTKFARISAVSSFAGFLAFLWIPTYATIAFRRTYGGSVVVTLAKEACIGFLYMIAFMVTMLVTIYLVAVFG